MPLGSLAGLTFVCLILWPAGGKRGSGDPAQLPVVGARRLAPFTVWHSTVRAPKGWWITLSAWPSRSSLAAVSPATWDSVRPGAQGHGQRWVGVWEVTASWHLLKEDLPKLRYKEPGSFSGTVKGACPWIGGVQRYRICPCNPPNKFSSYLSAMPSYKHIPVSQKCACPCTSASLIACSLFSGLPVLSPFLYFYQIHQTRHWLRFWVKPGEGRGQAWELLSISWWWAVTLLPLLNRSSQLPAVLFISMHIAASALLALDSSTTITTAGKQDTLETLAACCLLCVSPGLLWTQLRGAFLMPVCVCISRRGNCSNCMCSVLPARHLDCILCAKGLESKGSVYSVPKA